MILAVLLAPAVWASGVRGQEEPCRCDGAMDDVPPEIICPAPVTVERGDRTCRPAVQDWLDGASATDNCSNEIELVDDSVDNGFACGFPFDRTTTVTWTATDVCGNSAECSSTITVQPTKRVDASQKGSLLVFPNIELQWDAAGRVTQDTFVTITNDYPDDVDVHWYFINGDGPLDAVSLGDPPILVEPAHPGWNWVNCTTYLTHDEPTYLSALTGLPAGCQPFTTLDNAGGVVGRPDPEAGEGHRVLRGFAVAYAVDVSGHEIEWNHLSGGATIVNYAGQTAWEYRAYAFQATGCAGHGEPPPDCTRFDEYGTCCEASVIPGQLDLDGFQYDIEFDKLLLDFFTVGSEAFSTDGAFVMLDTDLTLLPLKIDLRQDSAGPITTKAHFDIWNQNEDGFSGTTRCLTCWDQTLLSSYGPQNHFLISTIHTDRGKARIDGVASSACPDSEASPILGVAAKLLAFSGPTFARAADVDHDGDIDLNDYREFARCIQTSGPEHAYWPASCGGCDLRNDGDVDLRDFRDFLKAFDPQPAVLQARGCSGTTLVGQGREAGTILTDILGPPGSPLQSSDPSSNSDDSSLSVP